MIERVLMALILAAVLALPLWAIWPEFGWWGWFWRLIMCRLALDVTDRGLSRWRRRA